MTARRLRAALVIGVALCFFAAVPLAAQAAAGDLDLSFGTGGKVTTDITGNNNGYSQDALFAAAAQSDGKIVAAGQCPTPNGGQGGTPYYFCLVRYSSDGSLDATFGSGGIVTTQIQQNSSSRVISDNGDGTVTITDTPNIGASATAIAVQSNGKIVVAGQCFIDSTTFDFCLARYNSDGSLDSSFGPSCTDHSTSPSGPACSPAFEVPGTVVTDVAGGSPAAANMPDLATGIAVQPDGHIAVVGYCQVGLTFEFCLARYTSDGSLAGTAINPIGANGQAEAVAVQANGKIVSAGLCYTNSEQPFCLARYNSDGSLDTSFGSGGTAVATPWVSGSNYAFSVAIQSDGRIVAAGFCGTGVACFARFNTNGSLDTSFGSDGTGTILYGALSSAYGVAVQGDGRIVAAGNCRSLDYCVVRFNGDGSLDATFGSGGTASASMDSAATAFAMALQSDGKIVVAGYCAAANQQADFCLARFEGDSAVSAPVITPSADVTAEATGPSGAAVSYPNPTATDAIDGTVPVICAPASGATFAIATTTVDCTATNSAGNSSHSFFTVTVRDTTTPTLTVPANISVSTSNPAGTTVSYTATASDLVDGPLTPSCVPASGQTFPVGTTTVNCSATDAHGNAAHASFTVTVTLISSDTRPPTLHVPGKITKQATGPAGALVTYAVTATDPTNPPAQITIVCTSSPTSGLSSGSIFPVGTTTITCNAHDPAGNNAAPKSFTITVRDTTKPVISPTANLRVNATGPAGAIVNYPLPTATDIVDVTVPVLCTPAPGATFAIGSTAVNCTATDHAGNTASRRFTVTVLSAAQQIAALKTLVNNAAELTVSTSTRRVRSTLIGDLNNALSSTQATACAAITKFIGDAQANTAPNGPITAANSTLWVSEATRIRAVRGC